MRLRGGVYSDSSNDNNEESRCPGKRITDHQMTKYKRFRQQFTQQAAAAKVGISVRSARRLEQRTRLPSQRGLRHWRTRADNFSVPVVSAGRLVHSARR